MKNFKLIIANRLTSILIPAFIIGIVTDLSAQNAGDSEYEYPYAFQKGRYFVSFGANIFSDLSKNQDQFIYYMLEEESSSLNLKLGFGYVIKDGRSLGMGLRYRTFTSNTLYENSTLDTVLFKEKSNSYIINFSYGITKSLFKSKKVFLISDPSVFLDLTNYQSDRRIGFENTNSEQQSVAISVGLNVGALVLLSKKMSVQATIGPVGVGYQTDRYYKNGEPDGTGEHFFLRMSPSILNLEISISRYF